MSDWGYAGWVVAGAFFIFLWLQRMAYRRLLKKCAGEGEE